MRDMNRREFVAASAALGAAAAVGIGGVAQAAADPAMSIARFKGDAPMDQKAAQLTSAAIEQLGGMKRFVSRGDVIWIKPNIGWNRRPEQAANTNPVVVATLVKLCLDAGAKTVKVGDRSCHEARQTYKSSGIADAAEAAGAEVVYLDDSRFRDVALKGERLKEWALYPEIIESDLVINVPIVKHHGLTNGTICMKNYMGIIGGSRGQWHQDIATCLGDITAYMKPRLSVVDATRVLLRNGPVGGNLEDVKEVNAVAAGTDIVALDAFGAEMMGHDPEKVSTILPAAERGLGTADYKSLSPKEIELS